MWHDALGQGLRRLTRAGRGAALRSMVRLCGGSLFRLCVGRWPDASERQSFAAGFVDGERVLPPVLRGLYAVPAAKEPLGHLAVLNLIREGVVRQPANQGPHRVPMPPFPGNPLSYWQGGPIGFLHFEKTAGLSLASLLTGLFHPLQIDDDPERATAPHVVSAFPAHAAEGLRGKALVWGHYDLPALRRLDPARPVVTILRAPAARILSLYHFWRSVDPALVEAGVTGFNVVAAHQMGLLDFLRCEDPLIRNYVDNVYVRRLTGTYAISAAEDRLQDDPDGCVAEAAAALRGLAWVGVVERMQSGLAGLARAVGAKLPARLPLHNATERNQGGAAPGYVRVAKEVVTPEIEAELRRLTRYDEVIYDLACGQT